MIKISLSAISNQGLYTLGDHIRKLLTKFDVKALGILLFVQRFLKALKIFEESMEKQNVSSEKVAMQDAQRDNYFVALKAHLRNFEYHPVAVKKNKAKAIYDILVKDGENIYNAGHSTQSASFRASIKEIDKNHMSALKDLFAEEWYTLFKNSQADFDKAIIKHTELKADAMLIASATKNRKALENSLRKLFAFLPMQYELAPSPELEDLIRNVQVEADRY